MILSKIQTECTVFQIRDIGDGSIMTPALEATRRNRCLGSEGFATLDSKFYVPVCNVNIQDTHEIYAYLEAVFHAHNVGGNYYEDGTVVTLRPKKVTLNGEFNDMHSLSVGDVVKVTTSTTEGDTVQYWMVDPTGWKPVDFDEAQVEVAA